MIFNWESRLVESLLQGGFQIDPELERHHDCSKPSVKFEQFPLPYPRSCAAPLQGIAPIATLERFVVYCSCEQIIWAAGVAQRARGIAQAVTFTPSPIPDNRNLCTNVAPSLRRCFTTGSWGKARGSMWFIRCCWQMGAGSHQAGMELMEVFGKGNPSFMPLS